MKFLPSTLSETRKVKELVHIKLRSAGSVNDI